MTYRRVVNRNGLATGDYGARISTMNVGPGETMVDLSPDDFNEGVDFIEVQRRHIADLYNEIRRIDGCWSALLGDLRRLERDAVDEKSVCAYVAQRTGIDAEVVAAVLKEFIAW